MAKYKHGWLIEQYKQEFGKNIDDGVTADLVDFIESNKSRQIYYDIAILFYYRKPLWYVALITRYKIKKAIKGTALEPFSSAIFQKITTDAKAKALQPQEPCSHCYDWRKWQE
ncbi:MAG: hypothetical protein JHC37_05445 [Campylobacteraceae bacterium]|nr:hypothetical protein [Campylobacteraceae bacterium]